MKHEPVHRLFSGLINFKQELRPALKPLMKDLAHGQNPELLLITCSDSRVVPHLITSEEPGDVFVVRSVGNLIAPADVTGHSVGDVSEASAIEYALEVLGIRDLAVCGHSNCGAMATIHKGRRKLADVAPNLVTWLEHGEPSKQRMQTMNFPRGCRRLISSARPTCSSSSITWRPSSRCASGCARARCGCTGCGSTSSTRW